MSKKFYTLLTSSAMLVLLAACSGDETTEQEDNINEEAVTTDESDSNDEDSSSNNEPKVNQDEKSDVKDTGSRTQPLKLGDTAKINVLTYNDDGDEVTGVAEIKVDNVVRGQEALELMQDEYSYYEEYDDEDFEWVVFDLDYKLASLDDEDYEFWASDDVLIYDEEGSAAPSEFATIPNEFESKEIFSGGSNSGKVARPAPKDKPFLIKFDDGVSEAAWFKVD